MKTCTKTYTFPCLSIKCFWAMKIITQGNNEVKLMRLNSMKQIGDVFVLQTTLGRCSSKFQPLSQTLRIAHVFLTQEQSEEQIIFIFLESRYENEVDRTFKTNCCNKIADNEIQPAFGNNQNIIINNWNSWTTWIVHCIGYGTKNQKIKLKPDALEFLIWEELNFKATKV